MKKSIFNKTIITIALSAMASMAYSAPAPQAPAPSFANATQIKAVWQKKYPNMQIKDVVNGPIAGIFELKTTDGKVYIDNTGNYLMLGGQVLQIVNISDQRVQPNQPQARDSNQANQKKQELAKVNPKELEGSKFFEYKKGSGSTPVYVFTDPDCPFCKRLEGEIVKLQNVTIRYIPYPIPQLHPDAPRVTKEMICSDDFIKSWHNYTLNGVKPTVTQGEACLANAEKSLQLNNSFSQKYNVEGTPTLIHGKSGVVLPGAVPVEVLKKFIETGAM